jgi:hypothetical protein
MSAGESEFEKKLQAIGAKYAHMYVARKPDNAPMKEFKLIEEEPTDGMSGMAEVLEAHVQSARNQRCSCGEWRPDYSAPRGREIFPEYRQHREHVVAMLTASGFGDVREAKAQALEEAADAWQVRMNTIGRGSVEAKIFLQVRAAAVRGEG